MLSLVFDLSPNSTRSGGTVVQILCPVPRHRRSCALAQPPSLSQKHFVYIYILQLNVPSDNRNFYGKCKLIYINCIIIII